MKKSDKISFMVLSLIAGLLLFIGVAVWSFENSKTLDQSRLEKIVFNDANVDKKEAYILKSEYEIENGKRVYEIEFTSGGVKYEYELDVKDGTILKSSRKKIDGTEMSIEDEEETSRITLEEAKRIALLDAGLESDVANFTEVELKKYEPDIIYEIEFINEGKSFEYEIEGSTGKIYSKKVKSLSTQGVSDTKNISMEEAKSIALEQAKLAIGDVTFMKTKLEHEEGMGVYEIEFYHEGMEYEYEIDAKSGTIIEYKREIRK